MAAALAVLHYRCPMAWELVIPPEPEWPDDDELIRKSARESRLAVMLLKPANRRVVEASGVLASLLRTSRKDLLGRDTADFIANPLPAQSSLALVAAGAIDGYRRRHRIYKRADGTVFPGDVWVTVWTGSSCRHVIAVIRPSDVSELDRCPTARSPGLDPVLAVGTVDGEGRLDRVSAELEQLLGYPPDAAVGKPVLAALHPEDAPGFLRGLRHAAEGETSVTLALRLRQASGAWCLCRAVLSPLAPQGPAAFSFSLSAVPTPSPEVAQPARGTDMLRVFGREVAAGMFASTWSALPTAQELPAVGRLSSREVEIVARLLAGDRVPLIARSLFLSQSTVRNHLTSVYRKLDVSSQQELLTALHGRFRNESGDSV